MNPNKFKLGIWLSVIFGVIVVVYFLTPACDRLSARTGDPRHLELGVCLAELLKGN